MDVGGTSKAQRHDKTFRNRTCMELALGGQHGWVKVIGCQHIARPGLDHVPGASTPHAFRLFSRPAIPSADGCHVWSLIALSVVWSALYTFGGGTV